MPTLLGIAGSLRKDSYNAALLRAAAEVAPEGTTIETASIRGIPLYDGDLEADRGVPPVVSDLKGRIAGTDAILLATPEYNNSIPGVLKNAIDWLSRPPKDIARVLAGRRVGLMGATPGQSGTRLAQVALLPVLYALGMRPWPGMRLYVTDAATAFDKEGKLLDGAVRDLLRKYMAGFSKFVTSS